MKAQKRTTMLKIFSLVFAFVGFATPSHGACTMENWKTSFDKAGYSTCGSYLSYLNGLYRSSNSGNADTISMIDEAKCCARKPTYYHQPTQCQAADWSSSFDKTNRWNTCPNGFFLQGLYRTDDKSWLHNIEYGKCCKPAKHPYQYGYCYEQNVGVSFNNKGTSKCKDGYVMTGLYRGSCDKLSCIEKFKCCQMFPQIPVLQSLSDAKTRVMDMTMYHLSKLAHYLGYGLCSGCRGQYVGEDFRRHGDTWVADKRSSLVSCSGYKSDRRLQINYGDFRFTIKDIKYGTPVQQSLKPYVYDEGTVTNQLSTPVKHFLEEEVRSVRTVTHTTTSSWTHAHELGIELKYVPPATGGASGGISYKFNYESTQTTADSTSNQQFNKFRLRSETTIDPKSAVEWKIMLSNSRSTVPYTATVLVHFSAQLDGFLRWGGGYNGDSTNYHVKHRGSTSRPSFPYRFGDSSTPFYKALKEQSNQGQHPWMWSEMMSRWTNAKPIIDALTNEAWYEFTLTGQFEDVIGQKADVLWKTATPTKRSGPMTSKKEVHDDDPPRVFPPPPKVIIDTGNYIEGERIPVKGIKN